MKRTRYFSRLLIFAIVTTLLSSCAGTPSETLPPEPTETKTPIPPTFTSQPPTETPTPPTRTPFPESCSPADPLILEIITAFELSVNEKNVEGCLALWAEDAILKETFKNFSIEGAEEIERFWTGYYSVSPPAEFRNVKACGNLVTFDWAELYAVSADLWPVYVEINDGKITYLDFYEDSTKGPLTEE